MANIVFQNKGNNVLLLYGQIGVMEKVQKLILMQIGVVFIR